MKKIVKYYKNSNTGDLLMSQEFTESTIIDIPIYFYKKTKKGTIQVGENLDLKGYVEISEKKFLRYSKIYL